MLQTITFGQGQTWRAKIWLEILYCHAFLVRSLKVYKDGCQKSSELLLFVHNVQALTRCCTFSRQFSLKVRIKKSSWPPIPSRISWSVYLVVQYTRASIAVRLEEDGAWQRLKHRHKERMCFDSLFEVRRLASRLWQLVQFEFYLYTINRRLSRPSGQRVTWKTANHLEIALSAQHAGDIDKPADAAHTWVSVLIVEMITVQIDER